MSKVARIIVVGSINMDLVFRTHQLPRPGETRSGHSFQQVPGGKGANQAVAAARLGAQVSMVGRIGDDGFSRTLIEGLARESIDTSFVKVTPNCSSGLAVIGVEDSGQNSITVIPGANGAVTPDDVIAAEELFRSANVLLVQFEVPLAAVQKAVELAHRHGVKIILDPAPSVNEVPADLLQVEVVCPNETEAESLSGQVVDSIETAMSAVQQIGSQGPQVSIITLGSQGAVVFDGKTAEHVPPFAVNAVDTTAAGDAFAAAFGIALAEQMSVSEATRFAAAAGALATTQHGAQPAMPTRDALEALLRSRHCGVDADFSAFQT